MPFSTGVVIPVSKGDKVRLLFELSTFTPKEHIATVTEVEQRYGCINGGRDKQNPLIYYTPSRLDELAAACDAVFVEEILERAPVSARPENIYRDAKEVKIRLARRVRGYLVGDLLGCVAFCLGKLDLRLTTPLHPFRAHNLYYRSRRGLIGSAIPTAQFGEGTIIVREKPFSKWVKDNATRLVYHRAELDAEETQQNMEYEEAYCKEIEDDMDKRYPDAPEDEAFSPTELDVDYKTDRELGELL